MSSMSNKVWLRRRLRKDVVKVQVARKEPRRAETNVMKKEKETTWNVRKR